MGQWDANSGRGAQGTLVAIAQEKNLCGLRRWKRSQHRQVLRLWSKTHISSFISCPDELPAITSASVCQLSLSCSSCFGLPASSSQSINTVYSCPVSKPMYRLSPKEKAEVEQQLADLADKVLCGLATLPGATLSSLWRRRVGKCISV